ncbi:MAG: hypothetical protein KKA31_03710, partial [Candidatus Margulisbacteria bacterium]|nr:hypothetical protein [Candidatus Margulisiibacteriota bacterium]
MGVSSCKIHECQGLKKDGALYFVKRNGACQAGETDVTQDTCPFDPKKPAEAKKADTTSPSTDPKPTDPKKTPTGIKKGAAKKPGPGKKVSNQATNYYTGSINLILDLIKYNTPPGAKLVIGNKTFYLDKDGKFHIIDSAENDKVVTLEDFK